MLATDVSTTCAEAILTLKMASAQVVDTSVSNNSPFQDFSHPDDHFLFNQGIMILLTFSHNGPFILMTTYNVYEVIYEMFIY